MVQEEAGGAESTVTVADPETGPEHSASLTLVTVYTVVEAGETTTVSGLLEVTTGASPLIE